MPRWLSSAPRKKLPPPTTTATSTPSGSSASRGAAAAISRAMPLTTSGLTPRAPPPKASPDSFRRTLRRRSVIRGSSVSAPAVGARSRVPERHEEAPERRTLRGLYPAAAACRLLLRADLEPGEALDGEAGIRDHLADVQLVVARVILLEQRDLLVERAEAALDDLGQRRIGLALVAADLLDDAPLVLDLGRRHVVLAQVLRVGERDVLGDAARGLRVVALVGDDDADLRRQVLARAVQVDRVVVAGEAHQPTQLELLADRRGLLLDEAAHGAALGRRGQRGLDVLGTRVGQRLRDGLRQRDELVVLGDEVGLAGELEHRGRRGALDDGHEALAGGAVG